MTVSEFSREQIRRYFRKRLDGNQQIDLVKEAVVECPFHDSADEPPSLSLFLDSGLWYCSKSGCGAAGDLVDFEQKESDADDEEQAWESIRKSMGLPPLPSSQTSRSRKNGERTAESRGQTTNPMSRRQADRDPFLDLESYVYELRHRDQDLYCLPDVLRADKVFIVSSRKDADRLSSEFDRRLSSEKRARFACTANSGYEDAWHLRHGRFFTGKFVVVVVANERLATDRAYEILTSVYDYARKVKLVRLPGLKQSGGISEWLSEHRFREFWDLVLGSAAWHSPDDELE